MLGPLALVVLSAASPMRLAAPGFSQVNVDGKAADLFVDYFAQQLSSYGIRVTTKTEIATLLGFERQKQLMGCSDDASSCMAELGGALGVDGIITGSVGKVGAGFVLTVKVVHTGDGVPLGSYSGRLATEDEVLDWLAQTAHRFATENGQTTAPAPKATPARAGVTVAGSSSGRVRRFSWVPAAVGVVAALVGLVFIADAKSTAGHLKSNMFSVPDGELDNTIEGGKAKESIGSLFLVIGSAALIAGLLMFIFGGSSS